MVAPHISGGWLDSLFNTWCGENTDYVFHVFGEGVGNETWSFSHTKMKSGWIKDLNVKYETIKALGKNRWIISSSNVRKALSMLSYLEMIKERLDLFL